MRKGRSPKFLKNGIISGLGYINGGSRDPLDPQMKHLCHGYADHLVIDESCSYFAQAYTLIQKVASSSSKLLLYITFCHKWSFK